MKTNILHAAFFTPLLDGTWGLPLLLWGPPGVAKTAMVRQLAKAYGLHCEHLTPGERGEGAFGVTPVPVENGHGTVLEYPPPEWVRGLLDDDGAEAGIVFLDELNCLVGDTPVTVVEKGDFHERPICEIRPGDLVASFDLQRGRRCVNRVSHVQHMPAPTIIRVQLADGRSIRATPNHRFYVNGEWVFASELRPGTRLHLLPDMRESFSLDHGLTSENARDLDAKVQGALPQRPTGGLEHTRDPDRQSGGGAAVTDAGPRIRREETETRQAAGGASGGVVAGAEGDGAGEEHPHLPGEVPAGAAIGAGSSGEKARAGVASRHVRSRRKGRRKVLALRRREVGRLRKIKAQLGGSGLSSEHSSEEFSTCNLGPHSSGLQEIAPYECRAADDRLHAQVGPLAALRGGRGGSCAHTAGGVSALAEPGLPERRDPEDGGPVRPDDTAGAAGGTRGLHLSGLDGAAHRGQGAGRRRGASPADQGQHRIVEIVAVEALPFDGEVWDLSVEIGHNFYANGILTHNTAPPALQPALLGAIQERRIGGHKFGPRVRVLGAANPIGHAAGGWDLAAPVANRLGHVDWPCPDADMWGAWLLAGQEDLAPIDAVQEETRVRYAWPNAFAKASGLAAAFVRRRPELLHRMPSDGDPGQSRAWPSPRTWEYAARARAAAEIHGLNAIDADEIVTAFLGSGAAGEWATWIEQADLPEPSKVLDGETKWAHDPQRLDRTEAVLSSCAALVAPSEAFKRKDRSDKLWEILGDVMADAKDICVPAMRSLIQAGLQRGKLARPVLAKMHSVVDAAGLTAGGR